MKEKGNPKTEGERDNGRKLGKEKDTRNTKGKIKGNKYDRMWEDIPTKGRNKITQYVTVSELKKGGEEMMTKQGEKEKLMGNKTSPWKTIGN